MTRPVLNSAQTNSADFAIGLAWTVSKGTWYDSLPVAQGTVPFYTASEPATGVARFVNVDVTNLAKLWQTDPDRACMISMRGQGSGTTSFALRSDADPTHRPQILITYTNATTGILTCNDHVQLESGSFGGITNQLYAGADGGIPKHLIFDFQAPSIAVQSATLRLWTDSQFGGVASQIELYQTKVPNDTPPVLSVSISIAGLPSIVTSGQSYALTTNSNGAPLDAVSIKIDGLLIGASNASGQFVYTPTTPSLAAVVSAQKSGYVSAEQTIEILNADLSGGGVINNQPSAITSVNAVGVTIGSNPVYTVTATGANPIVFSIAPAVAGWSINASTGVVTGPVLTANQSITIVATNGIAPPASQVVSFTVSALPQLVINGLPSTTVTGNTYPITVTSNGVAVAGAAITIDGNQVGVTNALGQFNLVMPAIGFAIPVYADKVGYQQALQVINITAFPVGPTITSAASWTGTHGQVNTFTHTATSGTPPYVWSVSIAPAGATINPSTGVVTFPASIP